MPWRLFRPFVMWLGNTPLGVWLGQSTVRIALLLDFHLLGITLFFGSIVPLCLRLLGLALRRRPVAEVAHDVAPFATAGLIVVLTTGALIFTGGAEAYFVGEWFRTKMTILAIAIVFHFTVFRKITRADEAHITAVQRKLTGAAALVLWFSVGIAGRAIGFFER